MNINKMKIDAPIFLSFILFFLVQHLISQVVTNHSAIYQSNIPLQQVGNSFTDPKFATPLKRISNARSNLLNGVFPDYSKRQAWNVDESLMMLRSGDGSVLIYNGQTYTFLQALTGITGVQDIFWHPSNPNLIYYILDNIFYSMNVRTLQNNSLFTFSKYTYVSTRAEGNISNDGHYIALCGYDINYKPIDFLVFDITANSIQSIFSIQGKVTDFDWISISPLGNYVIVDYATDISAPFNGIEVYDNHFNFLWRKPLGAGHSDYGLDANGDEVLIMDVYNADSNLTFINKYVLKNGDNISLISLSPEFDMHESCRAMSRPGWVYISTFDFTGRLTDDSLRWLPFEDEIFALKMDGSGSVQRFAHHHSRRYSPGTPDSDHSVYFSEPHATVNPSGKRILFGSNWRLKMEQEASVDAYIVDLSNLILSTTDPVRSSVKSNFILSQISFQDKMIIHSLNLNEPVVLRIYDLEGKLFNQTILYEDLSTINTISFPMGFYVYQISSKKGIILNRGRFIKE